MGAIVLFDGVCNFCNGSVNFIIDRDRDGNFKFAPLQSAIGQEMLAKFGINVSETDSIILIEDENAYMYSTAALRIAKRIGGIWSLLYAFIIVPWFIRDWAYRLFAKNRYRLFGKKDACMIPTQNDRARFLT